MATRKRSAAPPRPGRPTKLTPQRIGKIATELAANATRAAAASAAGVAPGTLKAWLSDGLAHRAEGDRTREVDLLDAVEMAEAQAEAEAWAVVNRVATSGERDADRLKAATWTLERRHRLIAMTRAEVTGLDGGPIVARSERPDLATWTDEERDEYNGLLVAVRALFERVTARQSAEETDN